MFYNGNLVKVEKCSLDDEFTYYLLTMHAGENRLDSRMNIELRKCIKGVEEDLVHLSSTTRAALLLTGTGKVFSLGLNLESYYKEGDESNVSPQSIFHSTFQRDLLAPLLSLPLVTVAAINGHAIAGGMVLALACDYRVMRRDRGLMAMNEIHLPSSIPQGMMEVVKGKVDGARLQREILLQGRRFTSEEAHRAGLVDELAEEDKVFSQSISLARSKAHPVHKRIFVKLIKESLYKEIIHHLTNQETVNHFKVARQINNSSNNDDGRQIVDKKSKL